MQAYLINKTVIAADIIGEAKAFYLEEVGGALPDVIDEVDYDMEVSCRQGVTKTVRQRIHEEMNTRNAWLNMAVPCDLHWPFIVGTLP